VSSLLNVFKVPELRKKIMFTVFILALYRLGTHIPTPGISLDQVRALRDAGSTSGGIVGFLNLFSGGALTNFSVFSLGIMPYITASIIMQLLTVVIPKLEKWSKEGATGQKKITQWTRYLAIALGVMQAATYSYIFHNGGQGFFGSAGENFDLFPPGGYNVPRVLLVVLTLTAGVALVMWFGELVTQRGIGNGMSILIFANVVSRLPFELENIRKSQGWTTFIIILLFILAMIVAIVFIDNGQRRIPVEFAKRMVGRRMMGGQNTYIPLKVNQAGVVPLIFASSVLNFPVLLGNLLPSGARQWINDNLVQSDNLWYITFYGLLIVFFAYFYTAISFDPRQQAESLQKQGGYIRPIRPGRDTETYLQRLLNRITLPGALFITAIALVPSFLLYVFNISNFGFAGTSILIAVGVALETVKQIDSQLMLRNYEGFLEGSATRRRPQQMVR
jgi:preprotein translocase subunit SecY